MPEVLTSPVHEEHAQELLRLERSERARLFRVYEKARLELLGRLLDTNRETFTAQEYRRTLVQIEAGLAALIRDIRDHHAQVTHSTLEASIEGTLDEIAFFEPNFNTAMRSRIRLDAVRRLTQAEGLLLHRFEASTRAYGAGLIGEIQDRLATLQLRRAPWREMAIDVAGRLKSHEVRGARYRAERIVRTELMRTHNEGAQAALEAAAPLIPGLKRQVDATIDGRTSAICTNQSSGGLNATIWGIEELIRWREKSWRTSPFHPHCRSRVIAYREEWEAIANPPKKKRPAKKKPEPEKPAKHAARDKLETRIRKNKSFETAGLYTPGGDELFVKKGGRRSVGFTPEELSRFPGNVLTHNHPSGGSFSLADVRIAMVRGLSEIRAVGREHTYRLRPPKGGNWSGSDWDRVQGRAGQVDREVYAEMGPKVARGEISTDQANFEHWHRVWTRVFDEVGFRYTRRKVNDG